MYPYYWFRPLVCLVLIPYISIQFFLFHIWVWLTGKERKAPSMALSKITKSHAGKIAIVTGANSGIGFETTKALILTYGMTVIMACMSKAEAEEAAEKINALVPPDSKARAIFVHVMDLSSYDSVREFAKVLKEKYGPKSIDVLINNAGVPFRKHKSPEGLDLTFQVNYLGHFLLTSLIVDRLVDGARIVNLSSSAHHFCGGALGSDFTTVEGWKTCAHGDKLFHTYPVSKLAMLFFSVALNRRFPRSRLFSVAVNPGTIKSNIWSFMPKLVISYFNLIMTSIPDGAQGPTAAALADLGPSEFYLQPYLLHSFGSVPFPTDEVLGPFIGPCVSHPRLPYKQDMDAVMTAFWAASEELTGTKWDVTVVQ